MTEIDQQSLAEQLTLGTPLNREIDGTPIAHGRIEPSFRKEAYTYEEQVKILKLYLEHIIVPTDEYAALVSGGIDSTITACYTNPSKLYTSKWSGYDETEYAKIVAEHLGLELKIININTDNADKVIPAIVKANGYPRYGGAGYVYYQISEEIEKDGFHTIVTGDGGDELFMRYGYTKNRWYQLAFAAHHRRNLKQAIGNLIADDNRRFYSQIKKENFVDPIKQGHVYYAFTQKLGEYKAAKSYPDKIMNYLVDVALQNQSLITERTLGIHGVRRYAPLPSKDIIEKVSRIPTGIALKPNKQLFKDAAKERMPPAIYRRLGKSGFGMLPSMWVIKNMDRIRRESINLHLEAIDGEALNHSIDLTALYYMGQLLKWMKMRE